MWFVSDNTHPAASQILEAIGRANAGHAASYGADAVSHRAAAALRAVFEAPAAEVFLLPTGTAANALALGCLCPPWGSVYCHAGAHVNYDECGAPEFYTAGAKLIGLDGAHGRIGPETLAAALATGLGGSVHNVQPAALSLTNATEAGTLYDPAAVAQLAGQAHAAGLGVHMDGARFANAVAALGCTPAELSWKAGIDVLSLGATKDGCLAAEAVLFFDPARAASFGFRRKRAGQLFSKHRLFGAQIEAWLADGLWLELAARANARAAALGRGLAAIPGVILEHPVEANAVFARWPRALHRAALAGGAQYHLWDFDATLDGPDDEPLLARLVCGWATSEAEVEALLGLLRVGA